MIYTPARICIRSSVNRGWKGKMTINRSSCKFGFLWVGLGKRNYNGKWFFVIVHREKNYILDISYGFSVSCILYNSGLSNMLPMHTIPQPSQIIDQQKHLACVYHIFLILFLFGVETFEFGYIVFEYFVVRMKYLWTVDSPLAEICMLINVQCAVSRNIFS